VAIERKTKVSFEPLWMHPLTNAIVANATSNWSLQAQASLHNHGGGLFDTLIMAFLLYVCGTGCGYDINLQVFDHMGSLKLRNEMDTT
jgi:hypothetical protein